MALLPYALRPSVVIRRKAIRQGILGPSLLWKVVAVGVFGRSSLKKFFGKQSQPLGTWKVASNSFVSVINAKPATKKQLKQAGTTRKARRDLIVAQAVADTAAKNPDAKIVVKTK